MGLSLTKISFTGSYTQNQELPITDDCSSVYSLDTYGDATTAYWTTGESVFFNKLDNAVMGLAKTEKLIELNSTPISIAVFKGDRENKNIVWQDDKGNINLDSSATIGSKNS